MAEKQLNAAGTHVWLSNAETGGVWECPPDYVPVALQRGWEYADAPGDSTEGLFDAGTDKPVSKRASKKTATKPGD